MAATLSRWERGNAGERQLDFEVVVGFLGLPMHGPPRTVGHNEWLAVDSRLPGPFAGEQLGAGGGQSDFDIGCAEIDEQLIMRGLFRSPQECGAGVGVVVAGPPAEIEESGEVTIGAGVVWTKNVRRSELLGLVTRSVT